MAKTPAVQAVWQAPPFTKAEVLALKALAAGNANERQQQIALKYIVYTLCGTYDWPYRPESDRDTAVALGKQWVGKRLVHLIEVEKVAAKEEPPQ